MEKPRLYFLVGPTAAGKSRVAVLLAKKMKAEIVSCDSMQVYKGMDILTSKPSAAMRKSVPHHLIGVVPPEREFDVTIFRRMAIAKIKGIVRRKKVPLVVGGTGLYMSVLVDGIFQAPSQKTGLIRQRLYKEAEEGGNLRLYRRLAEIDPDAARKIHPNDTRRIVRALEVFEATGERISVLQKKRSGLGDEFEIKMLCLDLQRPVLYRRIEERVKKMFRQGLVEEVEGLLKKKLSRTASLAIGIREIKGFLEGCYHIEEARRLIVYNTCQYARRQLTWFRKDARIQWLHMEGSERPAETAQRILEEWNVRS